VGVKLEPNHPYFVFVRDVQDWGGEVDNMFALVNFLSRNMPSVALVVNGGLTTLSETVRNARYGREIIVLEGSQRAAKAIIAAINGKTEKELIEILLDPESKLIKPEDSKQKLDNALSELREIGQYDKMQPRSR
jgi:hypothetical protein